uniref:Uncharacterized protein n=1 Tax=viral metagenome TaxID=1070528 RepID=A0A6M3J0S9_9ZZZZ
MNEIRPSDWENLTFNIMSLSDKETVIDKFKEIGRYPDIKNLYSENADADKYMRYIILFYDIGSQLRIIYQDTGRRKYEAAILAGFRLNAKNKFTGSVEKSIYGFDPLTNKAIISYLRIIKNPTYAQLAIFQDSFYIESQKLKNPNEKTKDVIQNIIKLRSEIESLTKEFLSGDTSQKLIYDIYESIEEENLLLKPEDVAKKLSHNKKVANE